MTDRGVFQMDKTESSRQIPVGSLGKCSQHPHLGGHMHISDVALVKKHALYLRDHADIGSVHFR